MVRERFNCKSAIMGALAALLLFFSAGQAVADESATYVGEKTCVGCHPTENKNFSHTLHAKVFRENPKNATEKLVCEACHGPGSQHSTNPTDHTNLTGYTKNWGTPVEKQTEKCLGCHKGGQRLHWAGSIHEVNQLSCSDCHNPMAKFSATGLLKKNSISETCYTCHQQQRAEFRKKSHMPLPEGKMSCEDCHNPHGSSTRPLLKADTVNDLCYACHAEKRGPYIWEHAPVRDTCLNCHTPHGSNHDKLLVEERPFICLRCHDAQVGHPAGLYQTANTGAYVSINSTTGLPASNSPTANFTTIVNGVATTAAAATSAFNERTTSRSCLNCHTQIHGSNHPSGARFQR